MRYITSLIISLLAVLSVNAANDAVFIHHTSGVTDIAKLTDITEITFSTDNQTMYINGTISLPTKDIAQLTYGTCPSKLSVAYNGTSATVENPYFLSGVTATVSGADVTIDNTNETTELTTELSGTTTDGSFTYNGTYKTTIVLNGVSITSTKGAAIDIECGKRIALELKKGTTNTLVDCADGKQKAALYCKGHLEIDKAGTLNITGNTKHALSAKEYIQLKKADGTINILGAVSDGIHCGQYFLSNGYTVNIDNIGGDGIQAEASGDEDYAEDYADGTMTIQGGAYTIKVSADDSDALKADADITINSSKSVPTFDITTTGAADKGIKSSGNINISAGTFTFTQSGSKIVTEDDASYSTAIKADKDITISGGTITINNTADGGKGISADGNVTISGSATVVDITANGAGGKLDIKKSADSTDNSSYVMYIAMPTTGGQGGPGGGPGQMGSSNYWSAPFSLYSSDGTLIATLTNTKTLTSGYTSKTFYYYDFKQATTGTYYVTAQNFTSMGMGGNGTYAIRTANISLSLTGEDVYYEISNSRSTSGTTYTFSVSNVTTTWNGSTSDSTEDIETYNASGIKADGNVTIADGTVTVKNSGAFSKSIKSKAVASIDGGTVTLTPTGTIFVNGSDASYSTGIKADEMVQNGGSLTITANGICGRGISADKVTTNGGTLTITSSGAGYGSGNNTFTAKGIKGDTSVALNAGTINIKMTGTGGKGIKSSGTYTQGTTSGGPDLTVATSGSAYASSSSAKAIKVMGAATIYGGTSHISTTTDGAEGLESKTSITIAGGNHYFKCYDDCINSSGCIYFNGGNTVCYGYGNDAVDSNAGRTGAITIGGGNVFAYTTKGSPEEGLDCDNNSYIVVTGGIAVSAGAAQGGGGGGGMGGWGGSSSSSSIGSSTQNYCLYTSSISYNSSNYYTLCNTSGTAVCTYKFEGSCSSTLALFTAPNLGSGTATVKAGTSKPTACSASVTNAAGTEVFFIAPTVTTSSTTASLTTK